MNTAQIWTLIIVGIIVAAIIIFILYKRGGRVETKYGAIIIPESGKNKSPESKGLFDYFMFRLSKIRASLYTWFCEELKKCGVSEDHYSNHNDAQYYQQCLGNIVYSGNGIRSIKSIIERELINGSYIKKKRNSEYDKYIDDVTSECMLSDSRYLNDNYRSETYVDTGQTMSRVISCDYLHKPDSLSARKEILHKNIDAIFDHAISLNIKDEK